MKFRKCTKDEFINAYENGDKKLDSFARTFIAKANMQDQWDVCYGAYEGDELLGAIILTVSKRSPHVANLQLLHTFSKHRRKGVAAFLCNSIFEIAKQSDAEYFRVSSEKTAVPFYKSLGMKMLGEQKSGTQLSMCKIGKDIKTSDYSLNYEPIYKAVYRKGKGGCVKVFERKNMELVNIHGSNGTGKGTRVAVLVNYLESKFDKEIVEWNIDGKRKEVGRIFDGKYFILGTFNKSGGWVGLDLAHFSTLDSRLEFFRDLRTKYPTLEKIIIEGYFNNRSKRFTKEELNKYDVDSYRYYFLYYDDIQEYIDRTNGRTGKNRGLEWAENAPGWRDNAVFKKMYDFYEANKDGICMRVDINAPKDFFVKDMFGENFTVKPKEESNLESFFG